MPIFRHATKWYSGSVDGSKYVSAHPERSPERRDRPRVTVAVPFRLYGRGQKLLLNARTLDLSTAGALLHGSCPAEVGEPVRVEVSRGPARNPLQLDATVVRFCEPDRSRRNHGIAVRFENLSSIDEAVLGNIINDAQG